jgi:hypothetical protein
LRALTIIPNFPGEPDARIMLSTSRRQHVASARHPRDFRLTDVFGNVPEGILA